MADLNALANQWKELAGTYSQNAKRIDRIFNQIVKNYSSSRRHYHNLDHVATMLQTAAEYKDQTTDYDAVRFAIWFHDVVYKALKDNNEEKSAKLAVKQLKKIDFPAHRIQKVSDLILKTKTHMIRDEHEDFDTQLLLDVDLMTLGAEFNDYKEYTLKIRKEYRLVPNKVYRVGRQKVLLHFLKAPEIYRTETFRSKYEQQARDNMKKEVEVLAS